MEDFNNPIFILQEITQLQDEPPPIYRLFPYRNGWKCYSRVNDIPMTTFSHQKYEAKRQCAKRIVELIRSRANNGLYQCPAAYNKDDIQDDPNFDTVALLNEICAKSQKEGPIYSELESTFIRGLVGIKCVLSVYITRGFATTKTEAKRLAARKMLKEILNLPQKKVTMSKKEISDMCKFLSLNPEEFYEPDESLGPYEFFRKKFQTWKNNCTIM